MLRLYDQTLGLGQPAWDIYMVYSPGVRWNGTNPPKPSYWMHQLGNKVTARTEAPLLDADFFRDQLLKVGKKPPELSRSDWAAGPVQVARVIEHTKVQ